MGEKRTGDKAKRRAEGLRAKGNERMNDAADSRSLQGRERQDRAGRLNQAEDHDPAQASQRSEGWSERDRKPRADRESPRGREAPGRSPAGGKPMRQ